MPDDIKDLPEGGATRETKLADALSERIQCLDGLPNVQALGKIRIGETPVEILRCALARELEAVPLLRADFSKVPCRKAASAPVGLVMVRIGPSSSVTRTRPVP